MKRWGKWSAVLLVVGGILAGWHALSGRATQLPPLPQSEEALFEQALPYLEEKLGCPLGFRPQFRRISAAELTALPDADLDAHIRWRFPQWQGEAGLRTRQIARQIVAMATIARYVEGSEIIALTDNQKQMASWDREQLTPLDSPALVQLALVHDVVRAHLDKRFSLAHLRRCQDGEEWDAVQIMIEGWAQAVTHHVARKLGSEALFPLLARRYLRVPDDAPDAAIKAVSQTALHARYRACTQGKAFFDALALADAETQVFEHLPRQMTLIARPQRWLASLKDHEPDLAAVLAPLQHALPAADWQPMQQSWTPTMLGQVAGMLGAPQDRIEKVAKTWYEGRSLVWTQRSRPDHQVALSVVRHENDGGARAYFGFALDLQRKQDTLAPGSCGPTIHVVESKSTSVRLDGFDEAVRNDKRIAYAGTAPIPVSLLLARTGSLVIECTWHGQTADAELAERLVQAVRSAAK